MDQQDRPTDDDDIARLLRAAGPREQLPEDMKQRWEQQFRSELQPVLQRQGRGQRRWLLGLCASLVIAVGAITLTRSPGPSLAEIRISHVSGQSVLTVPGNDDQAIAAGQLLAPGTTIATGPDGMVAISYGEYDLRLNRHTRLLFDQDRLVLESGELYASDLGSSPPARQLRILTAHGTIADIGTQFTVATFPDRTVTTVRQGAVLIDTGRAEIRSESLPGSATRLTVDRELLVQQEQVAPAGAHWNWIYRSSQYALEGKTAYEFLEWSVAQSGLQLEFASHGAEALARNTRLHGDISGLDPEQAVQPVLASTDLIAQRTASNSLRVSLNR